MAIENGYKELASDTEISNTQSIEIHKKLGFKETERVVCFLKKLT
jgi:aminoglycoside 6'-N-acetyltransferase I